MPHDAELRNRLKNVHTYAATPFTDDLLHLDLAGFERNLEFQVEHGMQVIAVGGGGELRGELRLFRAAEPGFQKRELF